MGDFGLIKGNKAKTFIIYFLVLALPQAGDLYYLNIIEAIWNDSLN